MKDIVEKEAKEEEEETTEQTRKEEEEEEKQQKDDDEQYDTVPRIKLVYEGTCVKEFRVTGNLNGAKTKTIMDKITPYIEMRAKVIYLFKSEIHWGAAGKIVDYSKTLTLTPPRDINTTRYVYKFRRDSRIH